MKNQILTTGVFLLVAALLLAVFTPCLVLHANAAMEPFTIRGISNYEEYFETKKPPVERNFVTYDMISCLGEFDCFRFGLKEGTHPEISPNYDIDYANYDYFFPNHNYLGIRSTHQTFTHPLAALTDGMQDMRNLEQKKTCRIRHNGLEYIYNDGILTSFSWEYADLQFIYYFHLKTIKTEQGHEVIRAEEIDMNHPIIGKLLSRDKKDVKEGLDLLKAHMYKNGFNTEPLIIWSAVALVVLAGLAVFLILRARLAKRKALSPACAVPDAPNPDVQP